jgi:hypothetical protein
VEDKRNGKDLENFLRSKLAGKTCEGETDEVVKALLDRSQGLFLYMKFLDQLIEEAVDTKAKNSKITLGDLDSHFPTGLGGIFADQFRKLHKELGHDSYHNLLSTVTAARSPLPMALWIRAHGLPVTGTHELTNTHTHTLTHAHALTPTLTHTHARTLTHTHTSTRRRTLEHVHEHIHEQHTPTHTYTRILTRTHTRTHTYANTYRNGHTQGQRVNETVLTRGSQMSQSTLLRARYTW